ncbi:multidrug DMT transporter permease [Burkholderia lata]|nr:multidrug DMT transporter permease [Burkholderia lata]
MTAIDTPNAARQPGWLRIAPALFLLLWASGFVFLKLGLRYADPLTFLALRYACVVALLAGPFLWLRPALPRTGRAWRDLVMVGLLLQAGYFAFTYLSLKLGMSAGAVALVTSRPPRPIACLRSKPFPRPPDSFVRNRPPPDFRVIRSWLNAAHGGGSQQEACLLLF